MKARSLNSLLRDAKRFEKRGELAEAKKTYETIAQKYPGNIGVKEALARYPSSTGTPSPATFKRLNLLYSKGDWLYLRSELEKELKNHPDSHVLWNMFGVLLKGAKQTPDSLSAFRKSVELNPHYAEGFNNLGVVLRELGRHDEAVESFEKALAMNPQYAEAIANMGISASGAADTTRAIELFEQALKISPKDPGILSNMGAEFLKIGKIDQALEILDRALALAPNLPTALLNYGYALTAKKEFSRARVYLKSALTSDRSDPTTRAFVSYLSKQVCDWADVGRDAAMIAELGISAGAVNPWIMLSTEDNLYKQRSRSERYAFEKFSPDRRRFERASNRVSNRIKVGYFSSDFYAHATLFLIAGVLREHDLNQFEIFLFSYGSKFDKYQADLKGQPFSFYDISTEPDSSIIKTVRGLGIDIAIDLKGYTAGSRPQLFALGLAPIQISFLGYPGTTGAAWIDYLIADHTVIPPEYRDGYSEKVIFLPHCYQPNDNCRDIATKTSKKSDFGLPDTSFVFCCFNASYKITATEFNIWMRIMTQIPKSVLWLLGSEHETEENLRKEAKKRNVDDDRLIFARPCGVAEHLERHRHADLFLDTFIVNAHTTASDALWAGLPLVTMCGQQFAARVSASLLKAVGLEELITYDVESYEKRILELSTDRSRLAQIRRKLEVNRDQTLLFDTRNYVNYYEQGLAEAYNRYRSGQEPADIFSIRGLERYTSK